MKSFWFAAPTLLALLVAGCNTTPISAADAKPAPAVRLLAYQDKNPDTTSVIIVTRDEGFMGGGCYYGFSINGLLAARLDTGETAHFYLVPGEYVLKSGRDPQGLGLCAVNSDEWTQRESVMHANETKYFRLSIDQNGKTDIQRGEP